jgi:hypothetical protein
VKFSKFADSDIAVVPNMKLSPNVGSDRSWVWNTSADVSEGAPEAQTLAIRFANAESKDFYRGLVSAAANILARRQPLQGGFPQGPAGERGVDHQVLNGYGFLLLARGCFFFGVRAGKINGDLNEIVLFGVRGCCFVRWISLIQMKIPC